MKELMKMIRTLLPAIVLILATAGSLAGSGSRTVSMRGDKLTLDLKTGASVEIVGGGSDVTVEWTSACRPECAVEVKETASGVTISSRFLSSANRSNSDVELRITAPRHIDVEIDSMGGSLSLEGLSGTFTGQTMGGELRLVDVEGLATLTTMGGEIHLSDSDLDGSLKTMGGAVKFENVVGDVRGSSMGGNVRFTNVRRRDGSIAGTRGKGANEATAETVQISTMGGDVEVEDAPEGADLHTMGGDIVVEDASEFVRAKTMGGDVVIRSVDGWVEATTMGGNVEVTVVGSGGDITLTSMSGDIELVVPGGFGMDLDLEIAYTKNSSQDFSIDAPGGLRSTVSPEWDRGHGTPRKYITQSGSVNGGGHKVTVRTVNGDITIRD